MCGCKKEEPSQISLSVENSSNDTQAILKRVGNIENKLHTSQTEMRAEIGKQNPGLFSLHVFHLCHTFLLISLSTSFLCFQRA